MCFRWKELVRKGKGGQIPLKVDDKEAIDGINNDIKNAIKRREEAKTTEEKLQATAAVDEAKLQLKQVDTELIVFIIIFPDIDRNFCKFCITIPLRYRYDIIHVNIFD